MQESPLLIISLPPDRGAVGKEFEVANGRVQRATRVSLCSQTPRGC